MIFTAAVIGVTLAIGTSLSYVGLIGVVFTVCYVALRGSAIVRDERILAFAVMVVGGVMVFVPS